MCGLLALVVRKGLNFESILCGLSPPCFWDRAASQRLHVSETGAPILRKTSLRRRRNCPYSIHCIGHLSAESLA